MTRRAERLTVKSFVFSYSDVVHVTQHTPRRHASSIKELADDYISISGITDRPISRYISRVPKTSIKIYFYSTCPTTSAGVNSLYYNVVPFIIKYISPRDDIHALRVVSGPTIPLGAGLVFSNKANCISVIRHEPFITWIIIVVMQVTIIFTK
jgi:hypothetical protein